MVSNKGKGKYISTYISISLESLPETSESNLEAALVKAIAFDSFLPFSKAPSKRPFLFILLVEAKVRQNVIQATNKADL